MSVSMKFEGGKDLEAALFGLRRAASKAVAKRVLLKAGAPIAAAGAANAPEDSGALAESYGVGVKLTNRQAQRNRRGSAVEVYVGPNDPAAIQTEFGNDHQSAQPHLRPAWDAEKNGALNGIAADMWAEIEKTAARAAKRAATKAAKAKG